MFSRISNAWSLAKSSWAVLQHDRGLAWLPVVGAIAGLVVGALFFGPVIAMLGGGSDNAIPAAGYLLMFLGYVATSAIFMWSRAAVIHGANLRMEGGDPTVGASLQGATARWPAVTGFAAVSVTVGLILNAIQENGGILGSIVAWIGDVAWGVIAYLVLPVVIIEGVGAVGRHQALDVAGQAHLGRAGQRQRRVRTARFRPDPPGHRARGPRSAPSVVLRWRRGHRRGGRVDPRGRRHQSPHSPGSSRRRSTARPPVGPSPPSSIGRPVPLVPPA